MTTINLLLQIIIVGLNKTPHVSVTHLIILFFNIKIKINNYQLKSI